MMKCKKSVIEEIAESQDKKIVNRAPVAPKTSKNTETARGFTPMFNFNDMY